MHPSVPCDILLDRTRKEIYGGILVSYTARCRAGLLFCVLRPPCVHVATEISTRAQTAVALSRCVFPGEKPPS